MDLKILPKDFEQDIKAVQQVDAVPNILNIIRKTTGLGFAVVARVTKDRWVACAVDDGVNFGMAPGDELKIETTFCQQVCNNRQPVIFDNADEDPKYANHPIPEMYGIKSYISIPIIFSDNSFFGTLCALDPQPKIVSQPHTREMFELFAALIASHLEALKKTYELTRQLNEQQAIAISREKFISIIGHDLRNPLSVCLSGAQMLTMGNLAEDDLEIAKLILSSSNRMLGLLDNLRDLTQARSGIGISTKIAENTSLPQDLKQIVAEQQLLFSGVEIKHDIDVPQAVSVDSKRIGQLFSNLLTNALKHGDTSKPIEVKVFVEDSKLHIILKNASTSISTEVLQQLFEPYVRGASHKEGLGLGLYIADQIARAHNGGITAKYEDGAVQFEAVVDC